MQVTYYKLQNKDNGNVIYHYELTDWLFHYGYRMVGRVHTKHIHVPTHNQLVNQIYKEMHYEF
jgi:hypothetical protein